MVGAVRCEDLAARHVRELIKGWTLGYVYKYNTIQQFFGLDIRFLVEMRDAFMIQVLEKNDDSVVWSKLVKLKKLLPIALVH